MNTVYRAQSRLKNPTPTRGLSQNSRLVQCHAVVVINHEMFHVRVNEHSPMSTISCVMPHKSQQNGKNVDHWIAHRNGLKANGENVQHPADKMERANVKFIVKLLNLMGKLN